MFKIGFIAVIAVLLSGNLAFSQNAFEDALKKAASENKRVVIDVYTDWCGW